MEYVKISIEKYDTLKVLEDSAKNGLSLCVIDYYQESFTRYIIKSESVLVKELQEKVELAQIKVREVEDENYILRQSLLIANAKPNKSFFKRLFRL